MRRAKGADARSRQGMRARCAALRWTWGEATRSWWRTSMSNEMSENTSEPNPEWERFKRDESEFVDKLLDPMCRASFDDDNPASVAYRNMMLAMFAMTWLIDRYDEEVGSDAG